MYVSTSNRGFTPAFNCSGTLTKDLLVCHDIGGAGWGGGLFINFEPQLSYAGVQKLRLFILRRIVPLILTEGECVFTSSWYFRLTAFARITFPRYRRILTVSQRPETICKHRIGFTGRVPAYIGVSLFAALLLSGDS